MSFYCIIAVLPIWRNKTLIDCLIDSHSAIRVYAAQVLNRSLDPRASPTDVQDMTSAQMTSLLTPMAATVLVPQQLITCGTTRNCVRMRGLPMEATVADILSILGDCSRHIVYQGVHLVYSATASHCCVFSLSPSSPVYLLNFINRYQSAHKKTHHVLCRAMSVTD